MSQLLASLEGRFSQTAFLMSSITLMELEHGWHRAKSADAALKRRGYLDELSAIIPVEPFTREMGVLGAKVDAQMKQMGRVIATADLLIGVTALYYGYAVGTRNLRHFQMIPELMVVAV